MMMLSALEIEGTVATAPEKLAAHLPTHLSPFYKDGWAVWRWICLRGTGFPADLVMKLAAPECAVVADGVVEAEAEAEKARCEALAALKREQPERADRRHPLVKAAQQLKKGRVPQGFDDEFATATGLDKYKMMHERAKAARAQYEEEFQNAAVRVSQVIYEAASSERFREALLWQNRYLVNHTIASLLRMSPDGKERKADGRKHERLVASYLQRYCVKNDTIGFFGPVGWGRVVPYPPRITLKAGKDFLASRTAYFEGWMLDEIVRAIGGDPALLPWIAPRRMPFIHFDILTGTLHGPMQSPTRLPAPLAALLALCDGERTAKDIAARVLQMASSLVRNEQQVYQMLRLLRDRGLITWKLQVSWILDVPSEWHLEANLRRLLDRIEDETVRLSLEAALSEMEEARRAITAAAGNVQRLDKAFAHLEERFTYLTGTEATRNAGQTYAGRTLLYEDCRRNVQVEISEAMLTELGKPLSLLLQSARWFTYEAAGLFRRAFKQTYDDLARRNGSRTVDAVSFWQRVQPLLYDDDSRPTEGLALKLQQHWADILCLSEDQRRAEYSSDELGSRVNAAFGTKQARWKAARYQSPDVMIAASSTEAIRRGDFFFVLGELHMGVNTIGSQLLSSQHHAPEELFAALEYDMREPRLIPITPKNMITSRNYPIYVTKKDYRLELASDTPGLDNARVIPLGSLVVEEEGGELYVRTRDSRLRFEIAESFSDALSSVTANDFKLLGAHRHAPRVTIDRLVVLRETWQRAASEMRFAFEKDEAERFLSARRWARELGVPRFAFVRVPVEVKPFYVDFASPIYVELLAKLVRRTGEAGGGEAGREQVTVSEMLPGPDEVWLEDAEGRRYTSELRIAALDLAR